MHAENVRRIRLLQWRHWQSSVLNVCIGIQKCPEIKGWCGWKGINAHGWNRLRIVHNRQYLFLRRNTPRLILEREVLAVRSCIGWGVCVISGLCGNCVLLVWSIRKSVFCEYGGD